MRVIRVLVYEGDAKTVVEVLGRSQMDGVRKGVKCNITAYTLPGVHTWARLWDLLHIMLSRGERRERVNA